MAKKREARKSKPKRTAKKIKPKKRKAKTPKKPPTSNVDAQTPIGPSVASDEALGFQIHWPVRISLDELAYL